MLIVVSGLLFLDIYALVLARFLALFCTIGRFLLTNLLALLLAISRLLVTRLLALLLTACLHITYCRCVYLDILGVYCDGAHQHRNNHQ